MTASAEKANGTSANGVPDGASKEPGDGAATDGGGVAVEGWAGADGRIGSLGAADDDGFDPQAAPTSTTSTRNMVRAGNERDARVMAPVLTEAYARR